jgi:ribosomal protein S18 acetylase RimI-like enzyme
MEFKALGGMNSAGFVEAWKIYDSSFPPNEKRPLSGQKRIFQNKRYRFSAAYEKGRLVGILTSWRLEKFIFIEHFAVSTELRNQGLGTRLMKEYMKANRGSIVLEAERLRTEISKRRIGFYKRLGFKLNRYHYMQPAYGREKSPVPCFLMSYPKTITKNEFTKTKEEIYRVVYGIEKVPL